jgi:hypothetical protein
MKKVLLLFLLVGSYCLSLGQAAKPTFDLDHIIIWTEKGVPELKLFEEKGFTIFSRAMPHTGFGTEGRYIFFYNILLEFLYPNEKATFDPTFDRTLLTPRPKWRKTGESPFGIGLSMTPYDTANIPFHTKEVKATWMPPNTSLFFATSSSTHAYEPQVLIVHPSTNWVKATTIEELRADIEKKVPAEDTARRSDIFKTFSHANGVGKLTSLKVTCKARDFSSTMKALKGIDYLHIVKGKEPLMEMTFDENRQKKTLDFRPNLPVIIKY